ncbi:pyrroline-5-carboxylate reductase-like [Magnolia sinica]|uniref:pyrroline-5-carboxylate reductase-like n=1 Tax=Magnolia sinica TaxID=86752 RepID=UPI00265AA02A|nr:pyrroline-5-carboxylate reductase-like [Magnolia sinica]
MADGGVAAGLPRDLALKLASQTVLGAAAMAINSGKHPGQLKDDVATPAGTTIAGVRELENDGFRGTSMNAVIAAANWSRELSESCRIRVHLKAWESEFQLPVSNVGHLGHLRLQVF